jgi:Ca2+-dependent lipid-binding protein
MPNSVLTVHVVEARNLLPMDMEGTSDPYVVLEVENQRIQTSYKKSDLNPVWNESFTFDIEHGQDTLKIVVFDKDTFGQDDFEGECEVSLQEDPGIRGQKKVDIWCDLFDKEGNGGRGKIRLQVQWIYSRFQYFDEYVTEWERALEKDIEDKQEIEARLDQMERPFGFLDTLKVQAASDDEAEGTDE